MVSKGNYKAEGPGFNPYSVFLHIKNLKRIYVFCARSYLLHKTHNYIHFRFMILFGMEGSW